MRWTLFFNFASCESLIIKTTPVKHRIPWYNDVIYNVRGQRHRRLRIGTVNRNWIIPHILVTSDRNIGGFEIYHLVGDFTKKLVRRMNVAPKSMKPFLIFVRCSTTWKWGHCRDIIRKFPTCSSKSFSLDTILSWLIKRNLDILLSPITKIVNTSLYTGSFPCTLRNNNTCDNKSSSGRNHFKNFRPVANLPHLFSKSLRRHRHIKKWTMWTAVIMVSPFSLRTNSP